MARTSIRRTEQVPGPGLMKFEGIYEGAPVEPGGSGVDFGCFGTNLPALAGAVRHPVLGFLGPTLPGKLTSEHGFRRSYNWRRLTLRAHGRKQPAPRRGAHRRKRERRPLPGMMLHQALPGRVMPFRGSAV